MLCFEKLGLVLGVAESVFEAGVLIFRVAPACAYVPAAWTLVVSLEVAVVSLGVDG